MVAKKVLVGKILASRYRRELLESLGKGAATPTMLEKRTNVKISHISEILRELADLGLVNSATPELRKGKLYEITSLGKSVLKEVQGRSEM